MTSKVEHSNLESTAYAELAPASAVQSIRAVAIAILLVIAFWPTLTGMYGSWFDDRSYMEHGILVIPAAAYMAWTKRENLARIPAEPSRWGIVLLFWGAVQGTLSVLAF